MTTPVSSSSGTAAAAVERSSVTSRPVAACGRTGTVRKTAEATKPSVPSLPTMSRVSISVGVSWSSRLLSP